MTMTMTTQEKKEQAARRHSFLSGLPFITYLHVGHQCMAYRSMSFTSLRNPTAKARYACKTRAHWKLRTLKKSYAKDGIYCMTHLLQETSDHKERVRLNRYARQWEQEHGEALS